MRQPICLLAAFALVGCASGNPLGGSRDAFDRCFSDYPEKLEEKLVVPDPKGWRLVSSKQVDPEKFKQNPYVHTGCSGLGRCKEYWFQKDSGEIRYCVTDNCWMASVDFGINGENWSPPVERALVCTT